MVNGMDNIHRNGCFHGDFQNFNLTTSYLCRMPMTEVTKRDIRKLKPEELKKFFIDQGDKAFRAQQVDEWLWKKSAKNFDQMTNLSLPTREMLKEHFTINHILVDTMQRSADGTIKNAVKLHDGLIVESVL